VAQSAAIAALDDLSHIGRVVSNNLTQAQILGVGLSELEYRVIPTSANFLYCDTGEDATGFAARLRDEGVLVRSMIGWGAPSCIRVSIGTPEQNERLLLAAQKIGQKH
jgi:histidinol-phosphate aminotransferase